MQVIETARNRDRQRATGDRQHGMPLVGGGGDVKELVMLWAWALIRLAGPADTLRAGFAKEKAKRDPSTSPGISPAGSDGRKTAQLCWPRPWDRGGQNFPCIQVSRLRRQIKGNREGGRYEGTEREGAGSAHVDSRSDRFRQVCLSIAVLNSPGEGATG